MRWSPCVAVLANAGRRRRVFLGAVAVLAAAASVAQVEGEVVQHPRAHSAATVAPSTTHTAPAARTAGTADDPAPPAAADERSGGKRPSARQPDDGAEHVTITLDDAAAIVRQSYGGQIVQRAEAPQPAKDDRPGARYRIRVDVAGRVKTVFVDQAGRIRPPRPRDSDAPADC